jgi:hypothetical protein
MAPNYGPGGVEWVCAVVIGRAPSSAGGHADGRPVLPDLVGANLAGRSRSTSAASIRRQVRPGTGSARNWSAAEPVWRGTGLARLARVGYLRAMPRILAATVLGLVGFVTYLVAAVTLYDAVAGLHWALQAAYFVVAGTLWVIPMRALMFWAARGRSAA